MDIIYVKAGEAFAGNIYVPLSQDGDTVSYTFKSRTGTVKDSGSLTFSHDQRWLYSVTPDASGFFSLEVSFTYDGIARKYFREFSAVGTNISAPDGPQNADLTVLANLKSFLNILDAVNDTILQAIITHVSAEIEALCDRSFHDATYTEYHNGEMESILITRQYPIISITSIHDDTGREYGSGTLIDSGSYAFYEDGRVYLDTLVFSQGIKNVKIVYVAGYATIPSDLELACIKMCASAFLAGRNTVNGIEGSEIKIEDLRDAGLDIIRKYTKYV